MFGMSLSATALKAGKVLGISALWIALAVLAAVGIARLLSRNQVPEVPA